MREEALAQPGDDPLACEGEEVAAPKGEEGPNAKDGDELEGHTRERGERVVIVGRDDTIHQLTHKRRHEHL